MPSSPRILVIASAAIGMLAGYAASSWLTAPTGDCEARLPAARNMETSAGPTAAEGEITALRSALDEERSRLAALEFEIEMLRSVLETQATATGGSFAAADETPDDGAGPAHATGGEPERDWFDQAALLSRGVDAHHAVWLNERFEELQMAELYLRGEATRGGWLGSRRHRDELLALRAETRETLTDGDYDMLLYAAGRNNRVIVKDLLKTSPAAAAGIEPGDVVLRYGDEEIFTPGDLIRSASGGDSGGTIPVDVWRDDERVRVYLPPGPLGVRIIPGRHFPAETTP